MVTKSLLMYICVMGSVVRFAVNFSCNHRFPKPAEIITGIEIEQIPNILKAGQSSPSNLRIYLDYQSSFISSPNFETLKTTVVEPARDRLQNLLQVKAPINGKLLVKRACINGKLRKSQSGIIGCADGCTTTSCLDVSIPDNYLKQCVMVDSNGVVSYSGFDGTGVLNYDIILLVTHMSCSPDTLAYAGSCFLENTTDRPILGVINLCTSKFLPNVRVEENIKIVIHEMIHALGMSVDKYAFYRYDNGTPIVPRNAFGLPMSLDSTKSYYMWNDAIIKTVTRNRASVSKTYNKSFNGFVLPNVLKAAQDHFNCPSLEAVDLEEFTSLGSGSALSHFDEYFLNNELMTPVSNNETDFLSKITLALLQDTGWYTMNSNSIGNLNYGYQMGCTLPKEGCYSYMQSKISQNGKIYPFCNRPYGDSKDLDCSGFNNNKCFCSLFKFQTTYAEYVYFSSIPGVNDVDVPLYSGYNPYNEYCPVLTSSAITQGNCLVCLYPVIFLFSMLYSQVDNE